MFITIYHSFLFVLLNFIGISFGVPSYEWDSTGTVRNVHTFAKFIDDLYTEYSKSDRMDTTVHDGPDQFSTANYEADQQKRAVFNYTFVKCAAEIAHFRVINANANTDGRLFRNFNVVAENNTYFAATFWHYDQSLGHQIANAFEREIFSPAKEQKIAKTVKNQIMQLAFSYAVRVLLYVIYDAYYNFYEIGQWQLRTLLSAFKSLSAQNDANIEENGIFPFQIIQIDEGGNHLWKQKLVNDENKLGTSKQQKAKKEEQKRYIENFKFILRLSDFEFTQCEIVEVLDQIVINKQKGKNDGQTPPLPAIYTFIMDHFRTSLASNGNFDQNLPSNRLDCAMVNFENEMHNRFNWHNHSAMDDYLNKKFKKCGGQVLKELATSQSFGVNNTPIEGSNQLVMDIFQEPLWNYVRVINVDRNFYQARKVFSDNLFNLVDQTLSEKKNKNKKIKNMTKTKEFKIFHHLFEKHGFYHEIRECFFNYHKKSLEEKISALKKLRTILKEILAESNRANAFKFNTQKMLFQPYLVQLFGENLYDILQKYNGEDNVRYDDRRQLLTFPAQIGERLIRRLCAFAKKNLKSTVNLGDEIDFPSALDSIASSGDNLESQKWIKALGLMGNEKENSQGLEWLFTLALRLCWQMEQNDVAAKYLPILNDHLPKFNGFGFIFIYKINVEQNLVRINLPNWNLPYFVYLENENELIEQKAIKTIQFLLPLTDYSPTISEVVQMAKIVDEMNPAEDGHIWVDSSYPKLFRFISQNATNSAEISRDLSDKIGLSVSNCFCFLAHFVGQLLEKAKAAKFLINIEFPSAKVQKLCTKERISAETLNNFGDANVMNIGKAVNISGTNELFDHLLSNNNYSLTLFDVAKMAKILHEMNSKNEHIFVGPSDPKIFLFILQNSTNSAKIWLEIGEMMENENAITEKIELSVANSFCFLAHFVGQLLEQAINKAEYLLDIDIVDIFIGQTMNLCTKKRIRKETVKIFGENVVDIGKKIKIDFNLRAAIQQKILPVLIGELETMINNEDWNCTNLKHLKEIEWVLLERGLMENGQSDKWKEIKKLINNWMEEFNGAFSEGKRLNFQKTVEELKAKLKNLKEGK